MSDRGERKLHWIVRVGTLLIRGLASTWRYRIVGDEGLRACRARGTPVVLALWHGTLLVPIIPHRGEGVAVLISEHRDGEIIARIIERLGLRTVRGSTTRGGGRALVALTRTLAAGGDIAITPDGPRGPREKFAPGALIAAQRSGAAIIAIGVHAPHAWRLKSWDRFTIPKPFSRVTIAYSEPTFVAADSPREAVELTGDFEELMHRTTARAAS